MTDTYWKGEPHTLVVHSVTLPVGPFDQGELEYDIEHPPSCKQEQRGEGEHTWTEWTCDIAYNEAEVGLAFALRYSGTPITKSGIYRIQGWGSKQYVWDAGAYEYDAGVGVMEDVAPEPITAEQCSIGPDTAL